MTVGGVLWIFLLIVIGCAGALAMIAASGSFGFFIGIDAHHWLKRRLRAGRNQHRALREARQLRRYPLTTDDFDDWCEVDESDA